RCLSLVQYAGSLTGPDFSAIAQCAPYALYYLVAEQKLATWVSLSKLVPVIWQPVIRDRDAHIPYSYHASRTSDTMKSEHFFCAPPLGSRWFDKLKFHLLLHLPAHSKCLIQQSYSQ
ncbi:hypothetical protein CVT26_007219, partial [Gymnopilus dilepis]